MNIALVDLHAQYAAIQREIDTAIAAVIQDTAFIGGTYLKAFEKEFASYCGAQFALGVSSGTDALRLALLACGVGAGDEVITVPNSFIATAEAISMTGATVRFVDVDPETFNMDPALLKCAITARTRAIIPVHLFGQPADMEPILTIAGERNIKVISDAAQAHGAVYRGRKVGTLGDAVCFSFYPGKNLGAYGDAGAVVTDDPAVADKIAILRDHGRRDKYEHDCEGFNCRMDGLQAAILSAKLRHLEEWTAKRRRHASLYNQLLFGITGVKTPQELEDVRAVYHLYVIRVESRPALQSYLKEVGIDTGIHYPIPLHRQRAYAYLGLPEGSFPISERLARQVLSLPMYPELTEVQIRFVADHIRAAVTGDCECTVGSGPDVCEASPLTLKN
jgi:dTDP-4-amino-4,6-dideoxygalactose transaminase